MVKLEYIHQNEFHETWFYTLNECLTFIEQFDLRLCYIIDEDFYEEDKD